MMFCQKCGKQLPDNAKFCGGCGTRVAVAAPTAQQYQAPYAPQQNAAKNQPKKKKGNFLVVLAVVLVVYFVAKFAGGAVAKSLMDTKETTPPVTTQITFATEPVSNPEYDKVFSDRFIIPGIPLFFGLESDAYVRVNEDGIVDHQQFGYKDDIVVEFIETVYVPVEGWTDAEKESYEQTIWDTYGNTGADCITLRNVTVGGLYINFTLEYKDMDNAENIRAAVDAGLLTMEDGYTLWGMSATEESLLAKGYIN